MRLYELFNENSIYNETYISEKLHDTDEDVDRIYNKYFKGIIDSINNKSFDTYKSFLDYYRDKTASIFLDELIKNGTVTSNEMIEVNNKLDGVEFIFNHDSVTGGYYVPEQKKVYISPSLSAIKMLINSEYDFNYFKKHMSNNSAFLNEFTEKKIKGTISHEMAHLYDNVMNNDHIEKWINSPYRKKSKNNHRSDIVHTTPFEIDGIIYTIKQFKRHTNNWDDYTFDDLINEIPAMYGIADNMKNLKEYNDWKKYVLKRLSREGLLSKRMK